MLYASWLGEYANAFWLDCRMCWFICEFGDVEGSLPDVDSTWVADKYHSDTLDVNLFGFLGVLTCVVQISHGPGLPVSHVEGALCGESVVAHYQTLEPVHQKQEK